MTFDKSQLTSPNGTIVPARRRESRPSIVKEILHDGAVEI